MIQSKKDKIVNFLIFYLIQRTNTNQIDFLKQKLYFLGAIFQGLTKKKYSVRLCDSLTHVASNMSLIGKPTFGRLE